MERLYCWKCDAVVPMLDADEWARIEGYAKARARGDKRERIGLLMAGYKALTGQSKTDKHAFAYHRTTIYGPPRPACGKPFRTPKAAYCAACGCRRGD